MMTAYHLHGPTHSAWLRCPLCGGRTSVYLTTSTTEGHLRCLNDARPDHPLGHQRGYRQRLRPIEAGVDDPDQEELRCPWPGLAVERRAGNDWTAVPLEPDRQPLLPRLTYPLPRLVDADPLDAAAARQDTRVAHAIAAYNAPDWKGRSRDAQTRRRLRLDVDRWAIKASDRYEGTRALLGRRVAWRPNVAGDVWVSGTRAPRVLGWIGLNPSKADHAIDDHTVRKMVGFSARWGASHLMVANLWTWVTSDPRELFRWLEARDGYGSRLLDQAHDSPIRTLLEDCDAVVIAWPRPSAYSGTARHRLEARIAHVAQLLRGQGEQHGCCPAPTLLQIGPGPAPRHPSRVSYTAGLHPWGGAA